MIKSPRTLKTLRQRIDAIDDGLHELLMERAAAVAEISLAKKAEKLAAQDPGREAEILKRLAARHKGPFPRAAMIRIWREIVGSAIAQQADLPVAVAVPDDDPGIWDLARDHYGSQMPMTPYKSSGEVLRALAEGHASAAVVAVPGDGAGDSWWRALASGNEGPRVTARLPWDKRGNARGERDAFVLSRIPGAPAGDRSVYALEIRDEMSRSGLAGALAGGSAAVALLALTRAEDRFWGLMDFDAFLPPGDERLDRMLAPLGERVAHVSALGFYAKPLAAKAGR
jgi:chorismate mutase / prephenate dehydratase